HPSGRTVLAACIRREAPRREEERVSVTGVPVRDGFVLGARGVRHHARLLGVRDARGGDERFRGTLGVQQPLVAACSEAGGPAVNRGAPHPRDQVRGDGGGTHAQRDEAGRGREGISRSVQHGFRARQAHGTGAAVSCLRRRRRRRSRGHRRRGKLPAAVLPGGDGRLREPDGAPSKRGLAGQPRNHGGERGRRGRGRSRVRGPGEGECGCWGGELQRFRGQMAPTAQVGRRACGGGRYALGRH
ncbi:unnamed protein product, partial [Ectocarpus sp. 12 AP-2014]